MKRLKTLTAIVALYACSIMALWAQAPYGQTNGQPWEAKYFHATIASGINPGENWYATDFDDSAWGTIAGPISNTSNYTYHTPWEGNRTAYWVRRSFTIDALSEVGAAYLKTIHDDGCLIYLNGHLIYEYDNVQGDANYEVLLTEEQIGYLNEGENLLAVYVSNSGGGEAYMDFGLEVETAENGIIYRGTVAYQLADRERTEYTIKEGTTHIKNDLFNGCSNMTSISIPSSVVSIGDNAFSGCSSLPVEGYIRYADCFAIEVTDQGQSTYTLKEGTRFLNNALFSECYQLESITIPEGVKEIKVSTFYNCHYLTNITLPEGLTTIEDWAFFNCSSLTNITLPEGLTTIEEYAFRDCSGLTNITLPEGLTTIEEYAFAYCSSLTNITLPESLTSIARYAFEGCSSLPVENGIRYADWCALQRVEDLTTFSLKAGTRLMCDGLFSYYDGLETISLPEGLLEISERAFYDCDNLRTVNLPSSLRAVKNYAFDNCDALTSLTFQEGLSSIGDGAFRDCDALTSVTFQEGLTTIGKSAFESCSALTSVKLPESLEHIGDQAFYDIASLNTINWPQSLQYIGDRAFYECRNLPSAILHEGLTTLGSSAFYNCTGIKTIVIPSTLKSAPADVFTYVGEYLEHIEVFAPNFQLHDLRFYYNNNRLKTIVCHAEESLSMTYGGNIPSSAIVYIPEGCYNDYSTTFPNNIIVDGDINKVSVTVSVPGTLGEEILNQVENLRDVNELTISGTINDADKECINNSLVNLMHLDLSQLKLEHISGLGHKLLFSINFPNNCKSLDGYDFRNNLEQITLPESLETIEDNCFDNCKNLKIELLLPQHLKTIGTQAFRSCEGISRVVFNDSLTSMGEYAFEYCYSLKSVELNKCLTSMGRQAFKDCIFLETVVLNDSLKYINYGTFMNCHRLKSITIPEGVSGLPSAMFYWCDSLTTVQLPQSIKAIPSQAFYYCSNLNNINLPEGLTQIHSSAFEGCSSLTNLQLPSTLMYCEGNAFLNTGLTSLTCSAFFPPIATGDLIGTNSCTLYVPEWTINNYKLANNWNLFSAIEPISDLYPENITVYSNASLAIPEAGLPTDYKPSMALIKNDVNNGAGRLSIRGEQTLPLTAFKMAHTNDVNTMTSLINYSTITADQVVTELNVSANQWHFLTFPYDVKISDVTTVGSWIISYYDGASRAQGQLGNNWKTLPYDSILHAGEGYIWQSVSGAFSVPAMDNDNRNLIFANDTRYIQLKEHTSEQAANSGWNLIGNPYPCFYDTRCMSFNAPITVRNSNSYAAYSPTDDSYILSPFEAFFVQCSVENNTVGFAPEGRQNDNTAIARSAHMSRNANHERHVFNVHLTGNAQSDRTRFVINDMAAMTYEMTCDAAKFMSDDASVPQIFCIEGGERLAINERPMGSGEIALGIYAGTSGNYTLSIDTRSTGFDAVLVDKLLNIETDLTAGNAYTFAAEAGTHCNRFAIRMNDNGMVNDIETAPTAALSISNTGNGICITNAPGSVMLYTLTGTLVGSKSGNVVRFNVPQGVYVVKAGNVTYKVSVTQ